MPITCTNNRLDPELVAGITRLGTKYECLRKGIFVGLNLPLDPNYSGIYESIDRRKIYCGNKIELPRGYDRFGNTSSCLQVGVGLGKSIKARNASFINIYINQILFTIHLLLSILTFLLLYYLKPKVIISKDINNNDIIDWKKFLLLYFSIVIIINHFISI